MPSFHDADIDARQFFLREGVEFPALDDTPPRKAAVASPVLDDIHDDVRDELADDLAEVMDEDAVASATKKASVSIGHKIVSDAALLAAFNELFPKGSSVIIMSSNYCPQQLIHELIDQLCSSTLISTKYCSR